MSATKIKCPNGNTNSAGVVGGGEDGRPATEVLVRSIQLD